MSKVITFSRHFPKGHIRQGQPTHFAEKIYNCSNIQFWKKLKYLNIDYLNARIDSKVDLVWQFHNTLNNEIETKKHHTIRAGNRWKVGDKFSPRVWSGKPYHSKQIILSEDLEVKQVYDIEIINRKVILNGLFFGEYANNLIDFKVNTLANNDGLSLVDFENWFGNKFFQGQIICWSDACQYEIIKN